MEFAFYGNFKDRLHNFIKEKRSLGFSYTESCRILSRFSRFCYNEFPNETALTQSLCTAWARRGDTETVISFRARLSPVREFARYLNRIGEKAYILGNGYGKKPHPPVPYIYSEEEIAALWSVADSMVPTRQAPLLYLVVPAIFRVMYCCGLRPDEARKLKTKNVDLDSGRIAIQESKKHADRIVMMSDDLLEYCRHYDRKMQIRIPNRTFFFSKSDGGAYTPSWFFQIFLALRMDAGITNSAHSTPRLYDFRHSFATHRLYSWMGEGKDLAAMLPYLSAYMGHARLSDTYYYIHLVPEQLKTISGLDFKKYESLLPEVEAYD